MTRPPCSPQPWSASLPARGFDFFPLTVDVEERMRAGQDPGILLPPRKARPSTEAILATRLIDRPRAPAFTKGIRNEVQVVVTVLTYNPDEIYNTFAINGGFGIDHALRCALQRPHRWRARGPD